MHVRKHSGQHCESLCLLLALCVPTAGLGLSVKSWYHVQTATGHRTSKKAQLSMIERFRALTEQRIEQCFHCHKCRAGCPVLPAMDYGPDRILRLLQLGHWEQVLSSRDIWLCLGCEMCGAYCPNKIDVGEVMIALQKPRSANVCARLEFASGKAGTPGLLK